MMRDPVDRYVSQYDYWRILGGEFGRRVKSAGIHFNILIFFFF
jgi:hypothetical protein